jgi:hypothetical protein
MDYGCGTGPTPVPWVDRKQPWVYLISATAGVRNEQCRVDRRRTKGGRREGDRLVAARILHCLLPFIDSFPDH